LYLAKIPFILEEKVKMFHDKQKTEQFMITRAALQKIFFKGILHTEEKDKCNHENIGNTEYY
jgi:hypothetical protein